jgi:hypothetical protein
LQIVNKVTQKQRGYGWNHEKLRKVWEPIVATGRVICAAPDCGRPILPGQLWDLGHDRHDRSRYTGPEHRRCNRQTSKPRLFSRRW